MRWKTMFKLNKNLQNATEEILLILMFISALLYLRWIRSRNNQDHLLTNRSTDKLNKQIFILAGQSNMAGQGGVHNFSWDGIIPRECQPNPDNILRLWVNMKWGIAHEPLNYGVDCLHNCGIVPGMAFANAILKQDPNFRVIGLVPCSRSGTGIHAWIRGSLPYDQLLTKAKVALRDGGTIRGLLWYHGESDSKYKSTARCYKSKFIKFIQDIRTDLNSPLLPVLVVVLHYPKPPFVGKFVHVVRQAQMDIELPNVIKVDANGLPVGSDGIHLTTQAQVQLGNMMAQAFLNAKFQSVTFNSKQDISYDVASSTYPLFFFLFRLLLMVLNY
ncbi:probable carbohydrate esterase At4g34215 [Lycium barbarum]|uniref:probable carbohydrate esterase At4g34215 n=1 Tax=Lycium barbarum TaxID=112863 RepID=UPI00293EB190|nr:probable carbohydrate esterase At4g34215 [Lycium barbarum]